MLNLVLGEEPGRLQSVTVSWPGLVLPSPYGDQNLNTQTWHWYWSPHLSYGNKLNKHISQNVEWLYVKLLSICVRILLLAIACMPMKRKLMFWAKTALWNRSQEIYGKWTAKEPQQWLCSTKDKTEITLFQACVGAQLFLGPVWCGVAPWCMAGMHSSLWEWLSVPQGGLCSPQEWQDSGWPALCLAPAALHLAALQHRHLWE